MNNPGGAGSEETTFYQDNPLYTASGSLTVTDENGVATTCLGQFKSVTNGGRVESTGFGFPSDRNNLVIQNSTTTPLSLINIQINQSCSYDVTLTPGQLYTLDMSDIGGTGFSCLIGDTSNSTDFNTVTLTGWDSSGTTAVGAGLAEAVVWEDGPFVYSPLPESSASD